MAALRIEVDLESKPDIGSGKSFLSAISRAPLNPKVEKREIHQEVRRGEEQSSIACNECVKYEERVPASCSTVEN